MKEEKYSNLYAFYKGPFGGEYDKNEFVSLENKGLLKRGNLYKVEKVLMSSSHTEIDLFNVDECLNSVAFDFYESTKTGLVNLDIYNDA